MALFATAIMALALLQAPDTLNTPSDTAPEPRRGGIADTWKRWFPGKSQAPLTGYRGDEIKTQTWSQGGWIIEVRRDGFADGMRCRLRTRAGMANSRITYADGALGFRFKDNVEPSKVWFRVDNRPAQTWPSVFRELRHLGVTVMPYSPDYRARTVVLIPRSELGDAQQVAIRAGEDGRPDLFDVRGFGEALDAAQRVGCGETSFVREGF